MLTALRKTSLTDGFQDEINMKSNILQAVETTAGSSIYNITTETGEIDLIDLTPTRLFIRFNVDNAGAAQIQINGRSLAPLVSLDGEPLEGHDILPNITYTVDYDGSAFLVNVDSAETLSNVMRYDSVLPLPTGPNNLFTYEDFFNHYVPIGEATVSANIGLQFPKYKVYPFNGNNFNITYGLLKWETDYTRQTITLEIDFPEIEEKYTIVKFLVISKQEDDPTCRISGSTEIQWSDWKRVVREVVQSNFYEGHYIITLNKPNSCVFTIEKTDGVEFAIGTSINLQGQTFINSDYIREGTPDYAYYATLTVRTRRAKFGRIYNRGSYVRVGSEGEPDKNKVVTLSRYMNTSLADNGSGEFETAQSVGLGDNDVQFTDAMFYMAAPNFMTMNSNTWGTDFVYDSTSKQESGIANATISSVIQDESGKINALRFVMESASTSKDGEDLQFHVTIKSPRKSDLDNLKIYY